MYESTKVAENIKSMSKSKGIQLKEMLAELKLNKNTLSNMYKGSMLKGDSLARIADYLDCSVDYLLGRTDIPEVNRGGLHLAYRAAHSSDDHEDELIYLTDEEVRRIEEAPETDEDF